MATSTLLVTSTFVSPSNASHKVFYVHLNAGAPQTLLFCYGAGDRSATLTLYQEFILEHPEMSLICVDRWTLPTSSAAIVGRSGPELLSELTSITVELLDSLNIHKFSIAAHSGGAYPMLHLAQNVPDRVQHLFPICTHIPPPFSASRVLSWMCSMPAPLFNGIIKLDSGGATSPTIERLQAYIFGSRQADPKARDKFVDSPALRELLKTYRPTPEQSAAATERQSLDYQLCYSRCPGIDNQALADMWMSLRQHSTAVTWFTTHEDAFFGPPSVQRLLDAVGERDGIEVVVVGDAKHADIHFQKEVWEGMYRRVVGVE